MELQLAAVYAADRGVLKSIMEATDFMQESAGGQTPSTKSASDSDVAITVLEDLAKLHKLKENFELLFIDGPVSTQTVSPAVALPSALSEEAEASVIKSKKERIVQLAKSLTTPLEETVLEVEPGFKTRKRKKDAMDSFIDQIAVTKQELSPESEKHKEQIEMIDHFIKTKPSISGTKDKPAQASDLTTIKTGEFGDHIISETLVEILLKQGKKEKAVEVLKKLIWKFPQKKAYFAAQIEELKK
jgi:hypothetical protein